MRQARHSLRAALAIGVLLAAGAAGSQGLPPSLRESVDALPPALRAQVLARQAQLNVLTAAELQRLQRRLTQWEALDATQQRARREAWASWQALPPLEQAILRSTARIFAALPTDEQQALRARYAALDVSERRGWTLGPVLGGDYPKLHPLLAQVPQDEHAALLATLRAMSPGERADLAVLAQRTPPQEREALRRELLSTAASQRAIWLRGRVDP